MEEDEVEIPIWEPGMDIEAGKMYYFPISRRTIMSYSSSNYKWFSPSYSFANTNQLLEQSTEDLIRAYVIRDRCDVDVAYDVRIRVYTLTRKELRVYMSCKFWTPDEFWISDSVIVADALGLEKKIGYQAQQFAGRICYEIAQISMMKEAMDE